MKRMLRRMKPTSSVLLAVVMTMTSLPQTGAYVRAAEPDETTIAVSENAGNDYLIDISQGYILKDANVVAKVYTAQFSAKINQKLQQGGLSILYTADSELAADFFPDVESIPASSLKEASGKPIYQSYPLTLTYSETQMDSDNSEYYEITAGIVDAAGYQGDRLKPNTTYYYRIVYAATSFNPSEYYFLTPLEQFTTDEAVETSSVTISSLEAEAVGYRSAKIVWTIENPEDEYIKDHYLIDTTTDDIIARSAYVEEYKDADGNTVPGKYYTVIDTEGETVSVAPVVEVYDANSTLTSITTDPLKVEPANIKDLELTLALIPDYTSLQLHIQVSPWYEVGDKFYFQMFYREKDETDWKKLVDYYLPIDSENTTKTYVGSFTAGTTYEYYAILSTDSTYSDCIKQLGSAEEPLTFAMTELTTYDDSMFDDGLRTYIKKLCGLSADQKLTSKDLEDIKLINILEYKDPESAVKSLKGIQYLPNLKTLSIIGHDITDASILGSITGLETINLYGNEITEFPDLSGLTTLKTLYFEQNKITSGFTADKLPAAFLEANPTWLEDTAKNQRIPLATPSQAEIKAMYANHPWSMTKQETYAVQPSTKSPYASGRLSDASLNNGLNTLNFIRYTAGLPYDVTLDDTHVEQAQAGTLIMSVNNEMNHYPDKPTASGFPDDLYELGYSGCSSGNLGFGYDNLAEGFTRGWMFDGYPDDNLYTLGHRRWVLNSSMSVTGFGKTGVYYAMSAHDCSRGTKISDFIPWPARNMPVEFVDMDDYYYYPWSIILGTDYYYDLEKANEIEVTMKDVATGKTWTFNQKTSEKEGNFWDINVQGFGTGDCITFRPTPKEVTYKAGSKFEISVSGLTDKWGKPKALSYTVEFFSLNGSSDQDASISLNIQECTLEKGATRQLKLYFVPNDTTLSKEATWTSSNPEVASVDAGGKVTALSKGTAVITATVRTQEANGTQEAKCTVTVFETAAPDEKNIPSDLCALTNVQTKLSDVSLKDYKGWEWETGDIPLAQFSGMQEKSFAAVYHEEGYAEYRTTLNVSLATVTGISVVADQTTLKQDAETDVKVQWKISGSDAVMAAYADSIQWSSSNPSLVEVRDAGGAASTGAEAVLKAGTSTGKANITAQITLGAKTYRAACKVTVVDGTTAVFENIVAEGFTQIPSEDTDLACYEGMLETQTGNLIVSVTNASKLTVKSSNAKVVSVGKVKSEDGAYHIPLTLKAAGMAKITLTANDAAKTTEEILLYVKDAKPNLSEDTIQVNRLKTEGALLYIYPNDGYTVSGYELAGADVSRFEELSQGPENDSYVINPAKDTPKGNYKLTIKVTVSETTANTDQTIDSHEYELPLTVKVMEQAPKYKVKQSAKANLFYKDLGAPQLTVTTEETLTGMALTGCDFKLEENPTEDGTAYRIVANVDGAMTTSSNKKGTLQLTFEGYEPISVPYTVAAENKKPKLALESKTVTFYPNVGIRSAKINIKSSGQALDLDSVTTVLRKGSGFELTNTGEELILSGGDLSAAATIKEEIEVTCDNWTESITLPFTIKVNMGNPSVKLKKSSLQLNSDVTTLAYDMAATEVMWKDAAYFDPDMRLNVSAANEKSQAVINDGIVFEQDGNQVIARLNNKSVAPGSYKFTVSVSNISGTPASLTVKVVNTTPDKSVKLSAKGSIDVLNRENSFVTVTPTLKSLNGDVTDVNLTGKFAHLFRAELDENNRILIYAKEKDDYGRDVALITKYPYSVNLVLTLTNAMGETMQFTTAEVKLKLKQGKPKVTVTPKSATCFSGAYNSVKLNMSAVLKDAPNPEIVDVELINFTDIFDYSDDILTLPRTGTAAKGKTYNLQFRITFRGQADNEKAVIVKYNVKVK